MSHAALSAPHPLRQYLPVLGMIAATVLHIVYVAVADNVVTAVEGLNIAIALVGAIATYVVPRLPDLQWLKPATAAATAGLLVLVNALMAGGITAQTWIQFGIQALAAVGVLVTNGQVYETIPGQVVDGSVVLAEEPSPGATADVQVQVGNASPGASDVVIVRDEPYPPAKG